MRFSLLLACAIVALLRSAEGAHPKCKSLCSVCETLHHTKVNQICAKQLLDPCSCSEFVVDNSTGTGLKPGCTQPQGFCLFGQEVSDVSGCPSERCRAAAGCPGLADWASRCGPGGFCPSGYRTDSQGCPTCDCVCDDPKRQAAACRDSCNSIEADYELVTPNAEGACPLCVCKKQQQQQQRKQTVTLLKPCLHRCPNQCGHYGFVNQTRDEHGCIEDCGCRCPKEKDWSTCPSSCPVTWSRDEFGCLGCRCASSTEPRWCPAPPTCAQDCGPYGFRVSPSTGCRTDCSCNCPPTTPATACPSDCDGRLDWTTDNYGCSRCTCRRQRCPQLRCPDCGSHGYKTDENGCPTCQCRCSSEEDKCKATGCQRWITDKFGCSTCEECKPATPCIKRSNADVSQLCQGKCRSFLLTENEETGCLTCKCQSECPPEPRCLIGCGPHPRKRDAEGCVTSCDCDCPKLTLQDCRASCRFNSTVVKDAYGCYQCKCDEAPRCPVKIRCSRSCGSYGYEADSRGCQLSCACNCPKRNCGCFFGSRKDEFGCDNCKCITLKEYLNANRIDFPV